MRTADLVVGEEYEITAQPNPAGPGAWPSRFESGRVKLLSVSGRVCRCEYLSNPYYFSLHRTGRGVVEVSSRSLLRPWSEVVAEQLEVSSERAMWDEAEQDRTEEAEQLLGEMSFLNAALRSLELDDAFTDSGDCYPGDGRAIVDLPLPVLRGLAEYFRSAPPPSPLPLSQEHESALAGLI